MTHETHRCSVEGCPNLAAYEVMLYDFDPAEGAIRFAPDETCSYICLEHAVDNERHARGNTACTDGSPTHTRTGEASLE